MGSRYFGTGTVVGARCDVSQTFSEVRYRTKYTFPEVRETVPNTMSTGKRTLTDLLLEIGEYDLSDDDDGEETAEEREEREIRDQVTVVRLRSIARPSAPRRGNARSWTNV